jgi:hypothetical protein
MNQTVDQNRENAATRKNKPTAAKSVAFTLRVLW